MPAFIHQGDIFYCHFEGPIKDRLIVVLSRSEINTVRTNVIVALVQTIRDIPLEIPVGKTEGLPKEGVVSLGDIHTVPKTLLSHKKGKLSKDKMQKVYKNLKLVFTIP